MASSSAKTLAIRGAAFNWLGSGCSFAIAFFITPFLVHTLGNAQYGLWSIVISLTGYYALVDFGLRSASVKYIAQYHAVSDTAKIKKVVSTSLVVYTAMACIAALLCAAVAFFAPRLFPVEGVPANTIVAIVLLTGGTVFVRFLSEAFNATLVALQRHDISNAAAISQQLAQAMTIVTVLHLGYGLLGMAFATLAVAVVGQGVRVVVVKRLLPEASASLRHFDRDTLKLVFRFGALTSLVGLGRYIMLRSGAIIVGLMLGPASVAYYAVAESLAQKAQLIGKGINSVIDPLASRLDATGARASIIKLMGVGSGVMLAVALSAASVFLVMGHRFLELWIGRPFAERSYSILCILGLAIVPRLASNPFRSILRGTNRLGILVWATAIDIVLTLGLAPWLIWQLGLIGMALAILAAQSVTGFFVLPIATCRALAYPLAHFIRESWLPSLGVGAVAIMTAMGLQASFTPDSLIILLLQAGACGTASALAAYYLCLDQERRRDLLAAIPRTRGLTQKV